MRPVLFTIENVPVIGIFPITSFGLSLVISFILGSFIIWRISRLYDFDAEKTFDLIFLSLFGGFLTARLFFILLHLSLFNSLEKIIFIFNYPGLSFWGGLLGSYLTLRFFCRKQKIHFWQFADFAMVGAYLGFFITSIGCLLGSCQYGLASAGPLAVTQIGVVGRRFPLQLVEGFLYLLVFLILWKAVLRFHITGQIAIKGLIVLSIIKFITEFFRGDSQIIGSTMKLGTFWSLLLLIYSILLYYRIVANSPDRRKLMDAKIVKRTFFSDLKQIFKILLSKNKRNSVVSKLYKSWYNLLVDFRVTAAKLKKNIFKLINVKSNPTKF